MELFTYFRSSAAYRVRIALNLKGMEAHPHFVHLVRDGGEQHRSDYRSLNPQALVPTLVDGEHAFTQSLAIIEYLEEVRPEPPLLPADTAERAWVRATAQLVACEIHPLNNLRVLQYLERELGVDPETRLKWYRHWVLEGFTALEARLQASPRRGRFCLGEAPTMADLCLVPQVYNARRFECDLEGFPEIRRIDAECLALDAFARAAPEAQPDAV